MAAEDELALPQVPGAKPNDPEDVSWALSTAEASWARGDHLEGIKWIFKAAEAASEVEDDNRALELAKSASDLSTLIARRSRASHGDVASPAGAATPEPARTSTPPTSAAPATARSQVPRPSSVVPPAPSSAAPPAPSSPPAPAPPQAAHSPSRPPPVPSSGRPPAMPSRPPPPPAPGAPPASSAPGASSPSQPPRAAPRPLATNEARQGPQAGRGILSNRTAPSPASSAPAKSSKGRRRSRENLDGEARAAGVLDTAPHAPLDGARAERTLDAVDKVDKVDMGSPAEDLAPPTSSGRARRRSRPEPDATVVARRQDLAERDRSAEEWDAHPTQNLTGDELNRVRSDGDRNTTTFALPAAADAAPRPPSNTVHDPEIQTSQAVRVVVWRDATGVHVAPAGTVVSSITIDAVLVVLEPSADLTAWLSQRER